MTEMIQEVNTAVTDQPSFAKHLAKLERREKLIYFAFVAPLLVYLAVFFIYPLLSFLPTSFYYEDAFSFEKYVRAFTKPVYLRILRISFMIAASTTLITLILAYPVAYLFTNSTGKIKGLITVFIILPFWTSIIVRMYAWMSLLGHNGIFNRLFIEGGIISEPIPMMFNRFGVLVGMVHFMLPYMVLSIYAVMSGIPPEYMQAGANLGAPPRILLLAQGPRPDQAQRGRGRAALETGRPRPLRQHSLAGARCEAERSDHRVGVVRASVAAQRRYRLQDGNG